MGLCSQTYKHNEHIVYDSMTQLYFYGKWPTNISLGAIFHRNPAIDPAVYAAGRAPRVFLASDRRTHRHAPGSPAENGARTGAHEWQAGWWLTYPSKKYESQLGLLFPIYGKIKPTRQVNGNSQHNGNVSQACLGANMNRYNIELYWTRV